MKVTIVIDGTEVSVEKGTSLLVAARRAGIAIPALCFHDALEPYGSCRLCLVEVTRGTRRRMTTSCNYPVNGEGETVSTSSPAVLRARAVVMELLLARCPGSEQVRATAASMGVTASRFPAPAPAGVDAEDEALVDCILCGLCVRACAEKIGASAIGFAERGPWRRVASPFQVNAAACIGCGACAAVCPTGVIRLEDGPDGVRRIPFLHTAVPLRRCAECGAAVAPEVQLEVIAKQAAAAQAGLALCPSCRSRDFAAKMARWTAATS